MWGAFGGFCGGVVYGALAGGAAVVALQRCGVDKKKDIPGAAAAGGTVGFCFGCGLSLCFQCGCAGSACVGGLPGCCIGPLAVVHGTQFDPFARLAYCVRQALLGSMKDIM